VPPVLVLSSVGDLEAVSSRTVWHVLSLGLEAHVLGIGFDLGVSVIECSRPADTRPLDTPAPLEAVNDYYRARCDMDALICARCDAVH